MSTAILSPPIDDPDAGPSIPSTLTNNSLPPLSELVKRSVKRTRAIYSSELNGIDDGLAKAYVLWICSPSPTATHSLMLIPHCLADTASSSLRNLRWSTEMFRSSLLFFNLNKQVLQGLNDPDQRLVVLDLESG